MLSRPEVEAANAYLSIRELDVLHAATPRGADSQGDDVLAMDANCEGIRLAGTGPSEIMLYW
jgi:hypothetical protein